MNTGKFKYGIDFVIQMDLPSVQHYRAGNNHSYIIDCPFCGRKRRMNIDTAKNVFACPACGANGGLLDLHKDLMKFGSRKEAKADLEKKYFSSPDKTYFHEQIQQVQYHEDHVFPLEKRDAIYNAYLDLLNLDTDHLNQLTEKRGLTPEQIKKFKYKTFDDKKIMAKDGNEKFELTKPEVAFLKWKGIRFQTLREKLTYFRVLVNKIGSPIPGWYGTGDGIASASLKHCFFIPVRSRHGEISCLQMRYDNLPDNATEAEKDRYHKYGTYSSSYKDTGCGASGIEKIHYTGFDFSSDKTPESVWLTEGALKADIASVHLHRPFIALIGVNNTGQLSDELEYLKSHGTKTIVIAIDMDYRDKPEVAHALETIKEKVRAAGLNQIVAHWDERYKGIDDFALAEEKKKEKER